MLSFGVSTQKSVNVVFSDLMLRMKLFGFSSLFIICPRCCVVGEKEINLECCCYGVWMETDRCERWRDSLHCIRLQGNLSRQYPDPQSLGCCHLGPPHNYKTIWQRYWAADPRVRAVDVCTQPGIWFLYKHIRGKGKKNKKIKPRINSDFQKSEARKSGAERPITGRTSALDRVQQRPHQRVTECAFVKVTFSH